MISRTRGRITAAGGAAEILVVSFHAHVADRKARLKDRARPSPSESAPFITVGVSDLNGAFFWLLGG